MIEAIRNLRRRKLRTSLTVFGIAIGIFALAVMGSLSEYLNTTVDSGIRYTGDIIRVLPKNSIGGAGAVKESLGDQLKTLQHVKSVSGGLIAPIDTTSGPSNPFSSQTAFGINPAFTQDIFGNIPIEAGRFLQASDTTGADLGHNLAQDGGLKVGDTKEIHGAKFTIIGIFKPTQNGQIDNSAVVPLSEIEQLNNVPGVVSFFIVVPDNPKNADQVAKSINDNYSKDFNALSPSDLKKTIQQGLLVFNIIILAGAALAAVVGGFSTINTMIMSVSERTREIGIKKAIGASNTQILKEFLTESALMGFFGGIIGVGLGKLVTIAINSYTKVNVGGLEIFTLTPNLALEAILFATLLGAVAGIIPAISASRMNVVKALRTE